MSRPLLAALTVACLFVAFGCSKSEKPQGPASASPGLKELVKKDLKEGDGEPLKKGDLAYVVYTGKLKNGTIFDSNDKADSPPLAVRVGEPGTILGWIEGIPGMKLHGKRHLEVPSAKGYGAQGSGDKIPPNSDLFFDVEVIDIVRKEEATYVDKTDVKVGTGPAIVRGDIVQVHYIGTFSNGVRFDSTKERNKPESFKVGESEVLSGMEFGVIGMKVGGVRKLRLPPAVAYGPGYNLIPPDMVVYFEVELLKVKKG